VSTKEVPLLEEIVPEAFHGTSLKSAIDITQGQFRSSEGKNKYLGDGVYFYEGCEAHAIKWARRNAGPIAVVQSSIRLGRCLDLNDQDQRATLSSLASNIETHGIEKSTLTDAVLINFLAQIVPIDSIRVTHHEKKGPKVFPGSRLAADVYRILCVRSSECILSAIISYQEN
jgi:hypothetical protein